MNTVHKRSRFWPLGLAVALMGGQLLMIPMIAMPAAHAAPIAAPATADSFPDVPDVLLNPAAPCLLTPITFFVRGYHATPCDSFIFAYRSGENEIVIRTIARSNADCPAPPAAFYSVPISFGMYPVGTHTIAIRRHQLSWTGDPASIDSVVTTSEISFTVTEACPEPPPPVPVLELPYVSAARTLPIRACDDRPTSVELAGGLPNGCSTVSTYQSDNGRLQLVISPYYGPALCGPAGVWSGGWDLGFLAAGFHRVLIEQTVLGSVATWPPILNQRQTAFFDFTVASECDTLSKPLPYVDSVHVGRAMPRLTNWPICPGEPYRVSFAGTFPNPCYTIRRVDVIETSLLPVVRVVVDTRACSLQMCIPEPARWDTSVVLPGLPTGSYWQDVQIAEVTCSDSILNHQLWSTRVPFSVYPGVDCDSMPRGCLLPSWAPGDLSGCNAYIAKDGDARLTLQVTSGTALAGLQGTLRFQSLGLRIANVEAVGPAAGMRVSWTPTQDGNARFVMFAEHGAPIPSSTEPVGVLRVTVQPAAIRVAWPSEGFYLSADELFGADVNGDEVNPCPTDAFHPWGAAAHICIERPCDFDANGVADVRDLVKMVHCVHGEGPCPADSTNRFDCDANGQFGLGDVLCCAVHILQGSSCPTCPIDSIRTEPEVRATFEPVEMTADGIAVRLQLWGDHRIGAARLALRFPADRYTFVGAEMHDAPWLEIHEGGDGEASVGMIRIGPDVAADVGPAAVLVRLALRRGAIPGGELVLEGGEFSGRDGVMLRVDLGHPRLPLDGKPRVTISSVRPNPSAAVFRISLSVSAAARVDVAVHDIAGRRVATVFEGERPAGTHEFQWDGNASDGVKAPGGVYFLRATAAGEAVVKKLILLNRSGSLPAEPH
jgi:hypothetical protein